MEAALDFLQSGDTLKGKIVLSQGAGSVATSVVETLLAKGVQRVIVANRTAPSLNRLKEYLVATHCDVDRVEFRVYSDLESLFATECDILSPNAVGSVLTPATISAIKAKIVCGAANSQLTDPKDEVLMRDRGVTYVPDFVCNRMGIVNCANEQFGVLGMNDPAIIRHFDPLWENGIFQTTQRTLKNALTDHTTAGDAALRDAVSLCKQPHPMFPGRGRHIRELLISERWDTKPPLGE